MRKYNPPYYAFISYCSSDEKWAKWLHKKLEYYHIPTDLCKKHSGLPERIRPVFWYKQDLSGTILKESLHSELNASKYLIVICSPESANSYWVNEEVQAFIDQGKSDKIIPFIVSGSPHSTSPKEECFPKALHDLSKDEEVRGIDVRRKEGKMHALVDVIATMFGIRFDELWNRYERRRRKFRNIAIAILALWAAIAVGVYDYTRTKKEYYADWVDCNGVALGIIPLTDNQVAHRYYSYKFEYSRVPFGEEGFYSWRLNRVSIVNSEGVISNYIPDNHAFFYPIQDYKYTDGYVTEIINRDTYNRVVLRYTIKDDNDHNVACLVDIEGKEKHQGSAYLSSSTTEPLSEANTNMSKIKRFHYTRNSDGYIIKVTYHANDADELDDSAIGDNNNIFGKKFDLDAYGRVATITYINHEGTPMTDKHGVGYIRFNNAIFEGNDTTEYLGCDKKLAYNEQRYARLVSKLDKFGNPTEQYYEGIDGKPCYNYKNIYRQVINYNNMGCVTDMSFYDFEGKPSYCSDNYSIQRAKYDSQGRCIEFAHYDVNDRPCYTKNNYSLSRAQYNSNDCITEVSVYDINGKPCVEKQYGAHCIRTEYDKYNYVIESSIFGTDNKPSIAPLYGFHLQTFEYDNYHRMISSKYYDEKRNCCINMQEYCCGVRFFYDTRGNLIKLECLDTYGMPCICKSGYATITYKYDKHGNCTEERYWGIKEEPIYIHGCSMRQFDYYSNGLLSEERCYDGKESLCLNDSWYAISRYEYDTNGNRTKVNFYDADTSACYFKNGLYSSIESEYNEAGNVAKETYYDICGNVALTSEGSYAIVKCKYDNYRRIVEYSYFDEKGSPTYYNNDYHILRVKYDKKGNVIQHSYYGKNREPTLSMDGSSIIQFTYDSKGNCIQKDFKNTRGKHTNLNSSGYSTEIVTYDDKNNIIRREYHDMYGKLCMINENKSSFYSSSVYKYDKMGNCVVSSYYDTTGKATKAMSYASKYLQYDEYGRIIEEKYKRYDGELGTGSNYNMSILRYRYDKENNYVSEILCFDRDSILQAHLYLTMEKGHVTRKVIRDNENKLKSMYIHGFTDSQYAMMTDSLNEYGQNIKRSYYGEDGRLGNTEEGFAYLINTYDHLGRITAQELFDENGKSVCGEIQKFHKLTTHYNEKGLIIEEACFDEKNHYINTPVLKGCCKYVTYYNERGIIDRNRSTSFISINGNAIDVKSLSSKKSEDVERTVDGSLVLANVELPGLFVDNGFEGLYCILEWNEWTLYDSIIKFSEIFNLTISGEKHLLLVPIKDNVYGNVIDVTFPSGTLGIRIMECDGNSGFNDLVDIYEDYKKTDGYTNTHKQG